MSSQIQGQGTTVIFFYFRDRPAPSVRGRVLVQLGTVPTVLSQTNALPASEAARTRVRASHLPCSRAEPSEAHTHTACAYSIQPGYGTLGTRPWYQGTYAYTMAMGIFPIAIFYIELGARTTILYARRDLPSN